MSKHIFGIAIAALIMGSGQAQAQTCNPIDASFFDKTRIEFPAVQEISVLDVIDELGNLYGFDIAFDSSSSEDALHRTVIRFNSLNQQTLKDAITKLVSSVEQGTATFQCKTVTISAKALPARSSGIMVARVEPAGRISPVASPSVSVREATTTRTPFIKAGRPHCIVTHSYGKGGYGGSVMEGNDCSGWNIQNGSHVGSSNGMSRNQIIRAGGIPVVGGSVRGSVNGRVVVRGGVNARYGTYGNYGIVQGAGAPIIGARSNNDLYKAYFRSPEALLTHGLLKIDGDSEATLQNVRVQVDGRDVVVASKANNKWNNPIVLTAGDHDITFIREDKSGVVKFTRPVHIVAAQAQLDLTGEIEPVFLSVRKDNFKYAEGLTRSTGSGPVSQNMIDEAPRQVSEAVMAPAPLQQPLAAPAITAEPAQAAVPSANAQPQADAAETPAQRDARRLLEVQELARQRDAAKEQ